MAERLQQRCQQLQKTTINKCAAAKTDGDNGWQEVGCGGGGRGAPVWRMTAAEEMRQTVSGGGATMALTKDQLLKICIKPFD